MNHTQGKPQCCGSVRGDGWGRPHQCARSGTLEHEGKLYCKTHHPPTVKAKDEERSARWRAEWAAEKAASEKKSAEAAEIKSKAAEYDAIKAERDALRAVNAELVEALEGLVEAEESMRATYTREWGKTPEDEDHYGHEQWAGEFLLERADAARAALAKAKDLKGTE